MLEGDRVSTAIAVAVPPAERISRTTVEIVEERELGSGGKGCVVEASEVVFAATTTASKLALWPVASSSCHVLVVRQTCVSFSSEVNGYLPPHASGSSHNESNLFIRCRHTEEPCTFFSREYCINVVWFS